MACVLQVYKVFQYFYRVYMLKTVVYSSTWSTLVEIADENVYTLYIEIEDEYIPSVTVVTLEYKYVMPFVPQWSFHNPVHRLNGVG